MSSNAREQSKVTRRSAGSIGPRVWFGISMFIAGACSSVAVQTMATPADPTAPMVRSIADAPNQESPNQSTRVVHLARGLKAYLGMITMQPGAQVPEHSDPTEEYIFVLEGSGELTIDGTKYNVQSGDTIFMPANAKVSFKNADNVLRGLQVFAGPTPADKYDAWTPILPGALGGS